MGKHYERIKSYGESYYDSSEGYKRAKRKQRADKSQRMMLSILIGIGLFVMFSRLFIGLTLFGLAVLGFVLKDRAYQRR